jgi:hypothetical protein
MNVQVLRLGLSERARPVKIIIPEGYTLIDPGQPKLTSATPEIKVAAIYAHEHNEIHLPGQVMLDRAIKAGQSPVDNISDLEDILTRFSVDPGKLVTGIKVCDPAGEECLLYVYYNVNMKGWITLFGLLHCSDFTGGYRILGYGK